MIRITFDYQPKNPKPGDDTGMSDSEFLKLIDGIKEWGGTNLKVQIDPS